VFLEFRSENTANFQNIDFSKKFYILIEINSFFLYEEAKNYDLIEGILEEIEMVDKILKGKN